MASAAILSVSFAAEPIDVGSRLEPFVDGYLISATSNLSHTLHTPAQREVAIDHDQPWEGNVCAYHTVFQDGALYRMYYRGAHYDEQTKKEGHPEVVCYAESKDGIHWTKPNLGLVEFRGSKENNIILSTVGTHNFAPFKDPNPACKPEQRYKALASNESGEKGLVPFQSADGIHWSLIQSAPVITKGAFDSQNLAFWDATRQRYVEFHRHFHDGVRDIMTSTSTDFIHWTEPEWLKYPGSPTEQLYTNQILPYERAPHLFFGFPMRYVATRQNPESALTKENSTMEGLTDGLFMTSRDGVNFHRWGEALIRPGLRPECWVTRNNMTAWGIVRTATCDPDVPEELSIYSTEHYYQGKSCKLRRFTLRTDGFASYAAGYRPGCLLTQPLRFAGKELLLNFSTAAAGWIRIEVRDADGKPIPGFRLEDCPEMIGDHIARPVAWKGGDLSSLAGKPIRLFIAMKEADLFAVRFHDPADRAPSAAAAPAVVAEADMTPADWCPAEYKAIPAEAAASQGDKPVNIGSHRELFVDRMLIDSLNDATLALHRPTYAGVVARRDGPWEGVHTFGYVTVIKDGEKYRMYYRAYPGGESADGGEVETTCYAESTDGICWTKPDLGLFEVVGTKKNNVILANMAPFTHNFCPFIDSRPGVPAEQRYKALGGISTSGLAAFASPDGIHWTKQKDSVIAVKSGEWAFDSQNVSFWSQSEQCYLVYFRLCPQGVRAIARTTSNNFLDWAAPVQMTFGDQGVKPPENLYTNQTQPYFRAPEISIATPARFMESRRVLSDAEVRSLKLPPDAKGIENDCSDACLMSTRGGDRYERTFMESWIRPGIGLRNWMTRSNYPALGIVPTGPTELSIYLCRHNAQESVHMARYTIRPDGFISVHAGAQNGELLTKPLTFTGKALEMNFSTSAAGSVRVEIQDAAGKPIPGFTLADCPEVFGDRLDQVVVWKQGSDVGKLAGQPIRLRFVLNDADLYAIRFQ
jgi:hypothetical protein